MATIGNKSRKIALVGNPNSGKTSVFNILTGLNHRVGNFSGVTVERREGALQLPNGERITLVDLPGIQTLYAHTEDEQITCRILQNPNHPDFPDAVLLVVDSTQLRRSLILATQIADLGLPTLLALNMSDLLAKNNDTDSLNIEMVGKILHLPTVTISARTGQGIPKLLQMLAENIAPSGIPFFTLPPDLAHKVAAISPSVPLSSPYAVYQMLLQPDNFATLLTTSQIAAIKKSISPQQADLFIADEMHMRTDKIGQIVSQITQQSSNRTAQFSDYLDRIVLHPIGGYFIFLALLFLLFQALFAWASYPMDWIDGSISWLSDTLRNILPNSWWRDLLLDGILAGVGGVVTFVPQIAFLFLFLGILEESGYMARVTFLMDRLMRPFGLSGRGLIPLIGGMACAVPAIMMTRTMPTPKERLITMLVTPLMSCSARLPIYILLITMFIPATRIWGIFSKQALVMMGMYTLGFLAALAVAMIFKKTLSARKDDNIYILELPTYRMPRWRNVATTIYKKCKAFVTEAGKVIVFIAVLLWVLASIAPSGRFAEIDARYNAQLAMPNADTLTLEQSRNAERLSASYIGCFGRAIEPAIRPLGYDWKIGIALITSFAAREVFVGTMATIYQVGNPDDEKTSATLIEKMKAEKYADTGKPVYTFATGISLLLFYAFAMQCMSTLAVVRRETGTWKWVLVMLAYMTLLAYGSAFIAYQWLSAS